MRKNLRKKITAIMVAVITALAITGCPGTKTDAPEPTPDNIVDGTHTQVIRMPNGFRNVAFTCYGTTGIYVTSRGYFVAGNSDFTTLPSSIAVIQNDSQCTNS